MVEHEEHGLKMKIKISLILKKCFLIVCYCVCDFDTHFCGYISINQLLMLQMIVAASLLVRNNLCFV